MEPGGQIATSSYDPLQRLVEARRWDGSIATLVYNARGDQVERIDPSGARTTLVFDPAGAVTARADATGRYTTAYDPTGLVLSFRSTDYPGDRVVTFVHDVRGELVVTHSWLGRTTMVHDARRQLIQQTEIDGAVSTWAYDPRGDLLP
jgi:YD repeat-containing protein